MCKNKKAFPGRKAFLIFNVSKMIIYTAKRKLAAPSGGRSDDDDA
jgi:hypothetical protein